MENRFKEAFGRYVCQGDEIKAEIDGFEVTATIYFDSDSGPPDKEGEGFWPVTGNENKDAPGYVLPEDYDAQMKLAQETMDGWNNDQWFYCGVALRVAYDGLKLTGKYDNAIWGMECNAPQPEGATPNEYLTEVANQLLDGAIDQAKARLAKLCAKARGVAA